MLSLSFGRLGAHMRKRRKQCKIIVSLSLICIWLSICVVIFYGTHVYGKENTKNVLLICSYNENFLSVPDEIKGIRSVLNPKGINLDIEYMDAKRFDSEEYLKIFAELIKYKTKNYITYDAVLVADDNALQFVMEYQEDLFPGLPIVFLGINDYDRAHLAAESKNVTGIIENLSLKDNVKTALKLNAKATKVVAIVDNTLTGIGDKKQFYAIKDDFPELSFEDINVSDYTFAELTNIFKEIENDTILLYLSMYRDKTGENQTIDQATELLSMNTTVPIYRSEIGGVGNGIFGGKMVSYVESGKIAAHMILDVLNGTPIETIEVSDESQSNYIFDYALLDKFKIDKKNIPEGTNYVNRKANFFEQNLEIVLITLGILSFLTILSIVSILDNMKRRKIEKELMESHEDLIASEEELRAQYNMIQEHFEIIAHLNQKYQIAIESTNCAVWRLNTVSKRIEISSDILNILNQSFKENEDVNELVDELFLPEEKDKLRQEYCSYQQGLKSEFNIHVSLKNKDNNMKWILVRGKFVLDMASNEKMLHGIILDITKMEEQEKHIEYLASHDYLTNLANRVSFMRKLNEEIETGKSGAIVLLDIDNFKAVNDTLGHIYGDRLLQEISRRLSSIDASKLFISRFGGDEFLIHILEEENLEVIEQYIQMINKIFYEAFVIDHRENFVNVSMGITRYPCDSKDAEQLIMNADTAMYKVKHQGKNSSIYYHKRMLEEIQNRIALEDILREALKNEGFYLVYQPQVNTMTGEIIGFEALIRLKEHIISPMLFIPVAEEIGFIVDIGRWVTRKAVEQLAQWKEKGFELKPIAINFSSKQLRDEEYCNFIHDVLEEYDVDSKYLEIEITESILLEKTEKTLEFFTELCEMGINITLDDFGSEFSSLNYLTFIPVYKIKMDKSLCDRFLEKDNMKIMENLIILAHSMGLEITAEGVEKIEQYQCLKNGGCDYIQGFLFSKPLSVAEIEKIYDKNLLEEMM